MKSAAPSADVVQRAAPLPDIGDEGRQKQQACRCDGRHEKAQNAHGNGRQAHARHPLDDAR
jgi:hypothetical protein